MLLSLPRRAVRKGVHLFKSSPLYNAAAIAELKRERTASAALDRDKHLAEAVEWLKRAQDATPDRGVSRGYGVGWVPYLNIKGWQPSYPETTGYIIPTFFDCATVLKSDELRRRAIEMADWEIQVQMPNGAVMGGTIDQTPTPAVFNTGQVMLGWIRVLQETGAESCRHALQRAADFLVTTLDDDGAWRRGNSRYASSSSTTYNSRVGWALAWTGKVLGNARYIEAGARNLDHTITRQMPNGWFSENDLNDPAAPLTHTIAYAMEGLLGGFDVTGERRYLDATVLAADHAAKCVDENGWMPGRINESWRGTVQYSCLTGSSQIAGVLFRLHALAGNKVYQSAATRLLRFVKRTQNCVSKDPGLRGGIKGSAPFDGDYGRYEVLNWPTKFFIDALLLERQQKNGDADSGFPLSRE